MLTALQRHGAGDWDDVCAEDEKANNRAVMEGNKRRLNYQSNYTSSVSVCCAVHGNFGYRFRNSATSSGNRLK
jgi:hypothetical protein